MKAKVANALALGLGSLLATGLGELGLRIFAPQPTGPVWFAHDPVLGDIPVPGGHGVRAVPGVYRFSFTHDAQGLRVVPAAAGVAATETLLVLGDSFTYGLGVDDGQTYCNRLQEALRAASRVVNAGNPAKGTDYALRFFHARGVELRPDAVLLAFAKNDFGDNSREAYYSLTPAGGLEPKPPKDGRSRRRIFLEPIPGLGWLLSASHLVNLVREAGVILTFDQTRPDQPTAGPATADGPRGHVWVDPGRQKLTKRYLGALRDAVRRQGASFLVFYVQDARDCWLARSLRPPSPDEAAFREMVEDLGLPFLSLTPSLAASPQPLESLYFAEGHRTPAAHALAARALLEEMRLGGDLRR